MLHTESPIALLSFVLKRMKSQIAKSASVTIHEHGKYKMCRCWVRSCKVQYIIVKYKIVMVLWEKRVC